MAVGSKNGRKMVGGLELQGIRPGSTEPPVSFNQTYTANGTPTKKSYSQYQERLFSGPGTQTYSHGRNSPNAKTFVRSRSESSVASEARSPNCGPRPSTPKRGAIPTKPSYVDETLFGEKPIEPDFNAPWDDGKRPVFVMDATDYKLQNKLREQRERNAREQAGKTRSSPMVASHTVVKSASRLNKTKSTAGRAKYKPSEVDELLFGNDHNTSKAEGISWEARSSPSHDPLNTGRLSVAGSRPPSREGRPPSPGRPLSGRPLTPSSGRPGSSLNKYKSPRGRHNPSYVDESLFGPRPVEPDFPAPWENPEEERRKARPLLFDAKDHRVVIDHGRPDSGRPRSSVRPRSSSARRNSDKPAPWR